MPIHKERLRPQPWQVSHHVDPQLRRFWRFSIHTAALGFERIHLCSVLYTRFHPDPRTQSTAFRPMAPRHSRQDIRLDIAVWVTPPTESRSHHRPNHILGVRMEILRSTAEIHVPRKVHLNYAPRPAYHVHHPARPRQIGKAGRRPSMCRGVGYSDPYGRWLPPESGRRSTGAKPVTNCGAADGTSRHQPTQTAITPAEPRTRLPTAAAQNGCERHPTSADDSSPAGRKRRLIILRSWVRVQCHLISGMVVLSISTHQ